MSKAEAKVHELVGMIQRGELRLPEMQRRFVWTSTRVRDLLDSLYRGYPSGAILLWETDEDVPLQEFSISQASSPYGTMRLLLVRISVNPATQIGRIRPASSDVSGHRRSDSDGQVQTSGHRAEACDRN